MYRSYRCAPTQMNKWHTCVLAGIATRALRYTDTQEQHTPTPSASALIYEDGRQFQFTFPLTGTIYLQLGPPCVHEASLWSWSSTSRRRRCAERDVGGELISQAIEALSVSSRANCTALSYTLTQYAAYTQIMYMLYMRGSKYGCI